jgi:hypothetical protein
MKREEVVIIHKDAAIRGLMVLYENGIGQTDEKNDYKKPLPPGFESVFGNKASPAFNTLPDQKTGW